MEFAETKRSMRGHKDINLFALVALTLIASPYDWRMIDVMARDLAIAVPGSRVRRFAVF